LLRIYIKKQIIIYSMSMKLTLYAATLLILAVLSGCVSPSSTTGKTTAAPLTSKPVKLLKIREASLPASAVKMTPELVISQFAGEPSVDANGNIYFVHYFYRDGRMIEADIYVAYHK